MKPNYRRCCGIDVHKNSVTVCVLAPLGQQLAIKKRKFRTYTRDLKQLRAWLKNCRVADLPGFAASVAGLGKWPAAA